MFLEVSEDRIIDTAEIGQITYRWEEDNNVSVFFKMKHTPDFSLLYTPEKLIWLLAELQAVGAEEEDDATGS